ncbi:MAG: peptidylprolyl isomerase [Synergistaceae bacterium]|nr:peptidylprolyl isomerase [Synergistaceae bacterium]
MLMNTLRTQVKWIMAAIVVIFVLSIFLMYGPGGGRGSGSKDYAVAEVDGKRIMRSQIEAGLAEMADQVQDRQISSEDIPLLRQNVLDSIIIEAGLKKEAKNRGIQVTDEEIAKVIDQIEGQFPTKEAFMQYMQQSGINEKKMRQDIADRLAQQKVIEGIAKGVVVSDDEVAKFYDSTKDLFFRRPAGYEVNFASFGKKEQAQKAREQLLAGKEWDKVIEAASQDVKNSTPYAKPTFVAEKDLTGPMKILLDLPMGKMSPLISVTSEDILLVLKRSRSPERTLSLAEVKEEIHKMLKAQKEREIQQKFLLDLKAGMQVKILDPSIFPAPKEPESGDKNGQNP